MPQHGEPGMTPEQATQLLPLLEGRRSQVDVQLWGGPTLLLAAQAFLYAAAFGAATPHWARIVVLGIGVIPLLVAWQATAKMRYLEVLHSESVARCMTVMGLPEIRRGYPETILRDGLDHQAAYQRIVIKGPTYRYWLCVFALFIITDLALMVLTILNVH